VRRCSLAEAGLDRALGPLGFAPEERPFHPHLTVGRVNTLNPRERDALAAHVQSLAAIRFGADWPDIHYRAGQLMFANNQPQQAREHFQRAVQLSADFEPAARGAE